MTILVVFAHPSRNSLSSAILQHVLEELQSCGHQIELLDLYAEHFDPTLSNPEWEMYERESMPEVQRYGEQINKCNGLVWVFPTWNYGFPAILKGYVDRVWKPGVAFHLDGSRRVRFDCFPNVKFFVAITTYGASWAANTFVGDPGRTTVRRGLRRHFPGANRFAWLALYGVDRPSLARTSRFLHRVGLTLRRFSTRIQPNGTPRAENKPEQAPGQFS